MEQLQPLAPLSGLGTPPPSPRLSPVRALMTNVWESTWGDNRKSWLRLHQAMRSSLLMAVQAGYKFQEGDLDLDKKFRAYKWIGEWEWFYRIAVASGNATAWKCYEAKFNRKPFIFEGAEISGGGHYSTTYNIPRLTVGATFKWKGESVEVTSINDEKGYLVACSYTRSEGEVCPTCRRHTSYPEKAILHRYTITHDDLKQARAEAKALVKAREEAKEKARAETP